MSSLYRSRRWGFEEISGGKKTSCRPFLSLVDADLTGLVLGYHPEGYQPWYSPAGSPVWGQGLGERGTCSLLPLWVQLQGEDGVLELTEEPLQHVSDILDEVVIDAQLDIAGIPPKLLHQYLDSGFCPVLAVNSLMPQSWGRDMGPLGPNPAQRLPSGAGALRSVPPAWTPQLPCVC